MPDKQSLSLRSSLMANLRETCLDLEGFFLIRPLRKPLESAPCPAASYLRVSQSEDDALELVDVSRCDGRRDDLGVDSDFPRRRVARVVGDTGVGARLQDVADAVVSDKHHGDAA